MRSKTFLAFVTALLVAGLVLPASAMAWTLDTHEMLNRNATTTTKMKSAYVQKCVDGDKATDSLIGYSAVYAWNWYIHFNTNISYHTHNVFFTTSDTRDGWWSTQISYAVTDYKAGRYLDAAYHVGSGRTASRTSPDTDRCMRRATRTRSAASAPTATSGRPAWATRPPPSARRWRNPTPTHTC
jgi:hypothetical protein